MPADGACNAVRRAFERSDIEPGLASIFAPVSRVLSTIAMPFSPGQSCRSLSQEISWLAISFWQPMASMVTMAPSRLSMASSLGMATISFDFSSTLVCPSTKRCRAAKAETMWIASWVGSGQHRQQAQKQHLRQRIYNLSLLPWVFQTLQNGQEKTMLSLSAPQSAAPPSIATPPLRISGSRWIQHSRRMSRRFLPDCPASLVRFGCAPQKSSVRQAAQPS